MRLPSLLGVLAFALAAPLSLSTPSYLSQGSQNQLLSPTYGSGNGHSCPNLTIIYAKGTDLPGSPPSGNVGRAGGVGPMFFQAVSDFLHSSSNGTVATMSMAVQGVEYTAEIGDSLFTDGDAAASQLMRNLAAQAMESCPNTHITLSGYSLGGHILTHALLQQMTHEEVSRIGSVVTFGSSAELGKKKAMRERVGGKKVLEVCHGGDGFCHGDMLGGLLRMEEHLNYGNERDVERAAGFVKGRMGL
ncbi:Putative cutinase/acetylxylan esterase, alpha/Beta hydrolase, cutinase, serine active [Septoria linicola]|uniref:Cutinase n=1 Tax=Septoria linicola TaxID=215465 RepID=A0A9Q9AJD4_9PEZI|nr:putative cutinase/acetylxylan esterase, alpha/Beta hydrolase, cutinase, serine active [Septoria linicola]USW50422.1 Putative cutinase/acetylxylan esterase, alpha/Beta hydrolase, cutinase, serine active [Septoria linicola]